MTNGEKFKEVFGFEVDPNMLCMASPRACEIIHKTGIECEECPFYKKWADTEYNPCFKLKEVIE